ncbi:MAG: protogloblin ApPgb [Alphaproteobacteria bacterium]|nr:protogloblin ApPgb [Alphaproteobacteria bacterium]
MNDAPVIPGYDYGAARAARSPVTVDELRMLEQTVGWTEADGDAVAMAAEVLAGQEEAMVDSWRSIIGEHEHLAKWFFGPEGKPDEAYKAAVKKRFVRWVADLCRRERDRAWLDYQEEIGLRHTPAKKNQTDRAQTPDVVPLRYLVAFTSVVITSAKGFLDKKGHSSEEVERMHAAWTKAVLLTLALWSRPYTKERLW